MEKGATPAWKDDEGRPLLGLIPLNMAEPIFGDARAGQRKNISASRRMEPAEIAAELRRCVISEKKGGEYDKEAIAKEIADSTCGLDIRWFHGKADLSESPIGYKKRRASSGTNRAIRTRRHRRRSHAARLHHGRRCWPENLGAKARRLFVTETDPPNWGIAPTVVKPARS